MLAILENKWDIKYIQTSPAPREGATENIGECKISCTLKIDVFEIPDNTNIEKLFSKYELLSLDQAHSSYDTSQILILQFSIQILPPSPFLSNFYLSNWNPSSRQSSSCCSSVSLFCPTPFDHVLPQVLDIANHMPIEANRV